MVLVARMDSRRVFVLGVAGLVPAALVTLLLVHQPSIGARRLYPMLRGPLTVAGFGLALATLIAWASATNRLSRLSLSGLAWAARDGAAVHRPVRREHAARPACSPWTCAPAAVAWATSRAAEAPVFVDDVLVVPKRMRGCSSDWNRRAGGRCGVASIDAGGAGRTGAGCPPDESSPSSTGTSRLPATVRPGRGRWSFRGSECSPSPKRATARTPTCRRRGSTVSPAGGDRQVRHGDRRRPVAEGAPGAGRRDGGAPDNRRQRRRRRRRRRRADRGARRQTVACWWTQSVVSLGKSRGYALPGAVQQVIVGDSLVFLSATADG